MTTPNQKSKEPEDDALPTGKKLEQLYSLIDGIQTAMMTTRASDGALVSRPMSTQTRDAGTDLWFVTNIETPKCDEIRADAHVNLAYFTGHGAEWVSVNGTARITQDRAKIRELYAADWKAYFGDEGGARNGGPDDPRIALIEVQANSAAYVKQTMPGVVVALSFVKGLITGTPSNPGSHGHLEAGELRQGDAQKK